MSLDHLKDVSMLDLFRQEAQAQTQVLNAGLLVLEREPADPTQLEACMRAAHSLKGAARIVGLDDAARLGHVMEDLLVAVQQGERRLTPEHIDALLHGSDALLRFGEGAGIEDLEVLMARLSGAALEMPAPAPAPVLPSTAVPEAEPAPDLRGRVLRVSAERLDLLLDLAGRGLVADHQMKPLGKNLHRLKRLQGQARRSLGQLREATLGRDIDSRVLALLNEANTRLAEAHAQLESHMEAFDAFSWAAAKRGQELYNAVLASRMRPCADLMAGKARMVRDLGRQLGKQVRLDLEGEHVQADRDLLERLEAPLMHLLRNAVDHGIESPEERRARAKPEEGRLRLSARPSAYNLILELEDDGAGIDLERVRAAVVARKLVPAETAAALGEEELLAFLFLPGFSMKAAVSEVSGRGVGLDVVQHEMRQLHGSVRVRQRPGQGTVFHLELPLTLSVMRCVVVDIGGEAYAIPLARIERLLRLAPESIVLLDGQQHVWHEGRPVDLIPAHQLLQLPDSPRDMPGLPAVVIRDRDVSHAVVVDRFIGEQSLVVMPLDPRLGLVRNVAAGALLDDGTPVLILDVEDLIGSIDKLRSGGRVERVTGQAGAASVNAKRILVVDDSLTVRELERKLLAGRGYEVVVAVDGMDGWNAVRNEDFHLLVTDIDMPRMDGIELVTLVRRDARLQALPVIIVSYKDREADRRRGLEAGADLYLAKSSFHDETLIDAVRMLIGEAVS